MPGPEDSHTRIDRIELIAPSGVRFSIDGLFGNLVRDVVSGRPADSGYVDGPPIDHTENSLPMYEVINNRRKIEGETELPGIGRDHWGTIPLHAHQLMFPVSRAVEALLGKDTHITGISDFRLRKPITRNLELTASLDPIQSKDEMKPAVEGSFQTNAGQLVYVQGRYLGSRFEQSSPVNQLGFDLYPDNETLRGHGDEGWSLKFRCPEDLRDVVLQSSNGVFVSSCIQFVDQLTANANERTMASHGASGHAFLARVEGFSLPSRETLAHSGVIEAKVTVDPKPTRRGFIRSSYEVRIKDANGHIDGIATWHVAAAPSYEHYLDYLRRSETTSR